MKFRAWNKRAKKWRVVNTLCWYEPETGKTGLSGAIVAEDHGKGQDFFMPIEYLGVVQYTGHHSIDNVEVYEGDVLRFPGLDEMYEVCWNNQEGAWSLVYSSGVSRLGTDTPRLLNQYPLSEAIHMQIAGSSHETPLVRSIVDKATTTNTKARGQA